MVCALFCTILHQPQHIPPVYHPWTQLRRNVLTLCMYTARRPLELSGGRKFVWNEPLLFPSMARA